MTRAEYFRIVILKSLRKRWSWLLGTALLIFLAGMMLSQPLVVAAAGALAALIVVAGFVAWGSFRRHKYEYLG
ncbi:hypothetical protein DKM44_02455 [Deinococcus irradiatisoli]|uniref:Uncharacterized protein n=1 Tax=Deinococcus irradiatisoli TaxID=2202254 RepID=A0A2Z3JAU7_9DEIO|nr:hypothetical protein [Deinococcus irradiatisoli]AWN22237.1 hypothetical protein DKM44_02455 [Deinococcus irradiatisoli]